jgi:hypothetical protein
MSHLRDTCPLPEALKKDCLEALRAAVDTCGPAIYARMGLEEHGPDVAANFDAIYEKFLDKRSDKRPPSFLEDNQERVTKEFHKMFKSDLEIAVKSAQANESEGRHWGPSRKKSYVGAGSGGTTDRDAMTRGRR